MVFAFRSEIHRTNVPGGMKHGWQHGKRCTTVESRAMTENETSKRLSSLVLVAMEE